MPQIFEITAPNGKTYEIEANDGVTQEQALQEFQALPEDEWAAYETKSVAQPQPQASPLVGTGITQSFSAAFKDNPELAGMAQSLWDSGERNPAIFNKMIGEKLGDSSFSAINNQVIAQLRQRDAYFKANNKRNPGNFLATQATGLPEPERPTGVFDTLGNAAMRGAGQVYNSGVGLAALGADLVGADETADALLGEYILNNAKLDVNLPRPVDTYEDIDSFGSAGLYALDTLGEMAPQLVGSLGTGFAGKEAAKRLVAKSVDDMVEQAVTNGMARESAEIMAKRAIDRAAQRGIIAGTSLNSMAQETGNTFGDTYMQTGEKAPGLSLLAGAFSGALDSILPATVLKNLSIPPSVIEGKLLEKLGTEGLKGFATEGITEAMQEFITQLPSSVITGESPFTEEMLDRMIDAGLRGGFGGGSVNVATTGINYLRTGSTPAPNTESTFVLPTSDKRTKAYRQEMISARDQVVDRVNTTTQGWSNAPSIEVHTNFKQVNGVDDNALGVYREDGTILLNTEAIIRQAERKNLTPEAVIDSVVFHEALGHYGMSQRWGEELDDVLNTIYENGTDQLRSLVDKWIANNPNSYKFSPQNAKKEDPLWQRIRATEEVLAEWSEKEGVLPKSIWDTIINKIKNFARDNFGWNLKISEREVRAYLATAQRRVTEGAPSRNTNNADKNMYIGQNAKPDEGRNSFFRSTALAYEDAIDQGATQEDLEIMFGPRSINRQETGWFKAPDGKWRFEIDDSQATVEFPEKSPTFLSNGIFLLEEVLDHPKLFEAYPRLRTMMVSRYETGSSALGSYNPNNDTLWINPKITDPDKIKSILLHEIQHGIQEIEGFAKGGNRESALAALPDNVLVRGMRHLERTLAQEAQKAVEITAFYDELMQMPEAQLLRKLKERDQFLASKNYDAVSDERMELYRERNKVENAIKEKIGVPSEGFRWTSTPGADILLRVMDAVRDAKRAEDLFNQAEQALRSLKAVQQLIEDGNRGQIKRFLKNDSKATFEIYEHLFGEVEARDVQNRMDMDRKERKEKVPYTSDRHIDPKSYIFVDSKDQPFTPSMSETQDEFYGSTEETYSAGFKRPKFNDRSAIEARKQFWKNKTNPDWNPNDPNGLPSANNRYMMGPEDYSTVDPYSDLPRPKQWDFANELTPYAFSFRGAAVDPETNDIVAVFSVFDRDNNDALVSENFEVTLVEEGDGVTFLSYGDRTLDPYYIDGGIDGALEEALENNWGIGRRVMEAMYELEAQLEGEATVFNPESQLQDKVGPDNKLQFKKYMQGDGPIDPDELTGEDLVYSQNAFNVLERATKNYSKQTVPFDQIEQEALARGVPPSSVTRWAGIDAGQLARRIIMYDIGMEKLSTRVDYYANRIRKNGLNEKDQAEYLKTLFTIGELGPKIFQEQSELGRAFGAIRRSQFTAKKAMNVLELLKQYDLEALADPETFYKLMAQVDDEKTRVQKTDQKPFISALNLPRAIMSSMDLSAPMRQGIVFIGTKSYWKSFFKMFSFIGPSGQRNYDYLMSTISKHPNYALMQQARLSFSDIDGKISGREEDFQSDFIQKYPKLFAGVRASERAYAGFLNKLRADMFNKYIEQYRKAGIKVEDPEFLRGLGRFINSATGRAELPGALQSMAPQLNSLLFSPRLMQSRFNMLANPKFYYQLPAPVRREAVKSMISMGVILGLTIGALDALGGDEIEVEKDLRSSDFGKVKVGNTRFDLGGGFLQYITLGARTAAWLTSIVGKRLGIKSMADVASVKTLGGDYKQYGTDRDEETYGEAVVKFFRGKLSPNASFVVDFTMEKNVIGEPFTWTSSILSRIVPMHFQSVYDAAKEYDAVTATAVTTPGVFGVGVNTYVPKSLDRNQELEVPETIEVDGEEFELDEQEREFYKNTRNNYFRAFVEEDIVASGKKWEDMTVEEQKELIENAKKDAQTESRLDMLDTLGL